MRYKEFPASFRGLLETCPAEVPGPGSRYVIMSDLHMGDGGSRDDLIRNRALVRAALRDYYLPSGRTLILAGDIEELQKFGPEEIARAWAPVYAILDEFAARGRLRKIVGNHDLGLLKASGHPYELLHGLSLVFGPHRLFCFHGHQASKFFVKYNYLSDFIVRFLASASISGTPASPGTRRARCSMPASRLVTPTRALRGSTD